MNKHGYHHTNKPSLTLFRRTKKYIVMAITFVLFFALCNYYMGLLSFDDHPVAKPVIPTPPDKPIIDNRIVPEEDDGNKYNSNDNKQGNSDNNNNKNGNSGNNNNNNKDPIIAEFPDEPDIDDGGDDSSVQGTCKHTRNRDYSKDPIVIAGRFPGREENCDIPCVGEQGTPDAVVGYRQSTCPHVKSIFFTMENSIPPAGAYDIVANTQLSSDVPLPYFSWAEYNFMNPVQKKTATAQVAAFISNCGPQRRLQWMEVMMQNGVTIDSFGSCMKNKAVPADLNSKYGSNYNALKIDLLSRYKFTMAFENSATDDYVTEKLFGVFVSGSVPLYDGAPNGKKFGPSPRSMLFADDFGTPEKMAEFILYLDSNDTAYEEYLSWKRNGPSDDWVALVDLSKVHSNCRLCIRTADLHRKEVGQVKHGKPEGEKKPSGNSLELHVRQRGKFWLRNIYLTSKTIEQLKQKALQFIPHDADAYVYAIYTLWTRMPVETDSDVAKLSPKTELEIIFVVPQDWRDKGLMPS